MALVLSRKWNGKGRFRPRRCNSRLSGTACPNAESSEKAENAPVERSGLSGPVEGTLPVEWSVGGNVGLGVPGGTPGDLHCTRQYICFAGS